MMNKLIGISTIVLFLFISGCDLVKKDINYTSPTGIYKAEENSVTSGYRKYLIELQKANNLENTYIISNFHGAGDDEFLFAVVRNDSIFITNQVISNFSVNGKGSISQDFSTITINYRTDDGNLILDFYARYYR